MKINNKFVEFINFFLSVLKNSFFHNYDIIHAVTYPSGLCALLPKLVSGKPLVVTIHDIGVIEKEITNVSPVTKILKGFLQGIVCSLSDAIIVPSEKVRLDIVKYHNVIKSKIFVTPYGIDHEILNEKVKLGIMRNRWKLKDQPIVLYVGMYAPKKGLEYLVQAMVEVKRKIPAAILVIAGPAIDRDYERKIKDLVRHVGLEKSVIFAGYFEEKYKPNVYADSNIVVEPTLYGMGYSFACVEASAVGKPVVATKLLESIGVVKNNFNGLTVPFRESSPLAESIIKILKNKQLYKKFSVNGVKFAKKFSWKKHLD